MNSRIALSIGDMNGIGPEVILKSLQNTKLPFTPVILGSASIIDYYKRILGIRLDYHYISSVGEIEDGKVNLLEILDEEEVDLKPGEISDEAGHIAMQAVARGVELCINERASALVTAPLSKKAISLAGYHVPGHTEYLAEKTGSTEYMMIMVNEGLRVGLATIHIPLKRVVPLLNKPNITRFIRIMNHSLKADFDIGEPRIAVLGVNPHASDGGVIGTEEEALIEPALKNVQMDGIKAEGPFAADGFFGNRTYEKFDGILAMYHDQGLIPFKTLSFNKGVNFTAGLPFIRTSPDHGTAFDIAGTNQASPESFKIAMNQAYELVQNRRKNEKHNPRKTV